MSEHDNLTIIVKKVKKGKHPHHGGSWKIAYADFVTAMMAFFMLLWLLSLLNKYQLQGVAAYFQRPLKDVFIGAKTSEEPKRTIHETLEKNDNQGNNTPFVTGKKVSFIQSIPDKAKEVKTMFKKKKEADKSIGNDEGKEMEMIKKQLDISLKSHPSVYAHKEHLSFELIKDGVKVIIKDVENEPMFSLGKADFKNYAKPIIEWLSHEFNRVHKKILIIGYTDGIPYKPSAAYTNWELSVDRANATRRFLIQQGMKPEKVIRIVGSANYMLLEKKREFSPNNRRIDVIILTDQATNQILEQ